jgi:hypothetical protein
MSRRHEMIEMLIDNDINTILSDASAGDMSLLAETLYSGFKGYQNYTEEELVQEMNERELWTEWFKETA